MDSREEKVAIFLQSQARSLAESDLSPKPELKQVGIDAHLESIFNSTETLHTLNFVRYDFQRLLDGARNAANTVKASNHDSASNGILTTCVAHLSLLKKTYCPSPDDEGLRPEVKISLDAQKALEDSYSRLMRSVDSLEEKEGSTIKNHAYIHAATRYAMAVSTAIPLLHTAGVEATKLYIAAADSVGLDFIDKKNDMPIRSVLKESLDFSNQLVRLRANFKEVTTTYTQFKSAEPIADMELKAQAKHQEQKMAGDRANQAEGFIAARSGSSAGAPSKLNRANRPAISAPPKLGKASLSGSTPPERSASQPTNYRKGFIIAGLLVASIACFFIPVVGPIIGAIGLISAGVAAAKISGGGARASSTRPTGSKSEEADYQRMSDDDDVVMHSELQKSPGSSHLAASRLSMQSGIAPTHEANNPGEREHDQKREEQKAPAATAGTSPLQDLDNVSRNNRPGG